MFNINHHNTFAQNSILPTKNHGQDSSYKKSPRLSVRGKILSDIGQRVYCAAVYDYLEVKMRTCRVAGSADSRYRLSCADMLSDTHRDRACKAITAEMDIRSRQDVREFLQSFEDSSSTVLSTATDGYHYHLVEAATPDRLSLIEKELKEHGFLAPLQPWEH